MLTISGAVWFSRRSGTCRLHAIYEPTVCYMEKVEKLSSLAGSAILAGEQSVPRKSEMVDPMFHHLFTLGKCVYLFRIHRPILALRTPRSIEQAQKIAELAQPTAFQRRERRNARSDGGP